MSETTSTSGSNGARGPLKGVHIGQVISDGRDKTRTVSVSYNTRHPKYGKYIKRHSRIHVHDQENTSHIGDRVEIVNCRPISKTKSWRLVRVLERAPGSSTDGTSV